TLDFDGELGSTQVSSLGLEKIPFVLRGGNWEPQDSWAPRLLAIVRALELRRRSLQSGQPRGACSDAGVGDLFEVLKVQNRALRATAWLIRSERDEALVSEDFRLEGETPDRPIDRQG